VEQGFFELDRKSPALADRRGRTVRTSYSGCRTKARPALWAESSQHFIKLHEAGCRRAQYGNTRKKEHGVEVTLEHGTNLHLSCSCHVGEIPK